MSKLKEFLNDIREMNKKYKCVPLIIFAVIYVSSPIDFIPELNINFWVGYLDDMAVLIGTCILTYMEVFSNERNGHSYERIEGVYSAVRRNTVGVGSRRDADATGSFSGDAVYGLPTIQLQAEAGADYKPGEPDQPPDPGELVFEPDTGNQQPTTTDECFFEQQIIATDISPSDQYLQQYNKQSRESFIIDDGSAIIW